MRVRLEETGRERKYLILDVENGPSWGWGPDGYTYSQVFCIAWKWLGDRRPTSVILDWRADDATLRALLAPVFSAVEEATHFIGHNFSHDTGLLVATAKDCGADLPDVNKPIIDTMKTPPKSSGSMRSLENLCAQFGLGEKPHLTPYEWKMAWVRWDKDALAAVRNRCEMDVILTERLYRKERELRWLQ